MVNRRHDRADIERALVRREAQGLTFDELALRTGIPAGTLSYWSHKLRREAMDESESGFVQLIESSRPSGSNPADGSWPASAVRIEHPSGLVIEFSGVAAEIATDRLLAELASWS
jgi:hypothetical protein